MIYKIILFFLSMGLGLAQAEKGILITAHGTSHGDHLLENKCIPHHWGPWEQSVLDAVEQVKKGVNFPIEVAFGMWETQCIDLSIEKIETQLSSKGLNLDNLIVVPLFLSDFSVVINAQKYIFRMIDRNPLPFELHQARYQGAVTFQKAINYNDLVSKILVERSKALVAEAARQGEKDVTKLELNIVMHGPVEQTENQRWYEMGHRYGADLAAIPFAEIHVISLQDDADRPLRDRNTEILRHEISGAKSRGHKALVLPLLVAPTGIAKGILERLTGLDYIWRGETLLPHPLMVDFLKSRL